LKKAMRRRNAKTVNFGAPTYIDASDVDYSTDEDSAVGIGMLCRVFFLGFGPKRLHDNIFSLLLHVFLFAIQSPKPRKKTLQSMPMPTVRRNPIRSAQALIDARLVIFSACSCTSSSSPSRVSSSLKKSPCSESSSVE
jgi:hypothetical protein